MNKILIALFLIVPVFAVEDLMLSENQILSYEIPPSAYLEKLAEISEKKAGKRPDLLGLFAAGLGAMMVVAQSPELSAQGGSVAGYLSGGFLIVFGVNRMAKKISDKAVSDEMKRFEQIKNEPDRDKKEVMAYNALVWFASSEDNEKKQSRSRYNDRPRAKNLNDLIAFWFLKSLIENSSESKELTKLNTIHDKALNGFLTQTPLDIVF